MKLLKPVCAPPKPPDVGFGREKIDSASACDASTTLAWRGAGGLVLEPLILRVASSSGFAVPGAPGSSASRNACGSVARLPPGV